MEGPTVLEAEINPLIVRAGAARRWSRVDALVKAYCVSLVDGSDQEDKLI